MHKQAHMQAYTLTLDDDREHLLLTGRFHDKHSRAAFIRLLEEELTEAGFNGIGIKYFTYLSQVNVLMETQFCDRARESH